MIRKGTAESVYGLTVGLILLGTRFLQGCSYRFTGVVVFHPPTLAVG